MKNQELGKTYKDGEIICSEGEEGKNMYIVQSGKVKVSKQLPHGVLTLTTLGAGDVFGEMALFDHKVRSATVEAVGEAVVLSMDKKRFFAKASQDPTLVFNILERLSNRIRTLNNTLSRVKESRHEMLSSFSDVGEICRHILEEVSNSITADNGSIMLLDENMKALKISAAFGSETDQKTELKEGKGIAGNVLTTGNIELVNDISADPRFVPGKIKIEKLLCAPIKGKNGVVGVVNLSRSHDNSFSSGDLKILIAISDYASIAIENTRLFLEIGNILDNIRPDSV